MMAWAFLESLLLTGALMLVSAILPAKWFREGFVYKGFVLIVIATITSILFQKNLNGVLPPPETLTLYWVVPVVLTLVIIGAVQMMPRAQTVLLNLADRVSIMLFLYVPIGLLSLMVVALGNLL
jgi:hypothetical protein